MTLISILKPKFFSKENLVFFFSFIILFNLGFHVLVYFPLKLSPDIQNYLAMAHLDFDQSPVRRYRIIIPMLASLLNSLFGWCFNLFHPWTFEGDFALCFSFLLVNTVIMSLVMLMLYKLCKIVEPRFFIHIIAITAILSSRWSAELSGLPLTDSLYLLCLVFAVYALISGNSHYLIASVWIGPWAKEAYIFMIPLIMIFSKEMRGKIMLHLIGSGILVFGFRYLFDLYTGYSTMNSILKDFDSFTSIGISLKRLFSLHGLYDLFSVVGFWMFLPFIAIMANRDSFFKMNEKFIKLFLCYLLIVLFQALLSSDLPRMFFLSIPVIAMWIAMSLSLLQKEIHMNSK